VTVALRTSVEDLELAIEWLEAYEAAPDEDERPYLRVAEFLKREVTRRYVAAAKREMKR
jgi:hypothetical protein